MFFSADSFRGVSVSSAYNKRVSLNDSLKAGDFTNSDTFLNYFAYTSDTPVGQIILN